MKTDKQITSKKKKKRGGKREGSGRKSGEPTTTMSFRIAIEKKKEFQDVVDEPNKKFKVWVDKEIKLENKKKSKAA